STSKASRSKSKIAFSGGRKFLPKPNEKIILVGPNNSGKSQSLRDILSLSQNEKKVRTQVMTSISISKVGSANELRQFLEKEGSFVDGNYRYEDWTIPHNHIQFWDQPNLPHSMLHGFIKKIAADDRLKICEQQNSIAPTEQKSKPQHILYDSQSLMTKISALFKRAFGKEIMFDFRGGRQIPIHVGELPVANAGADRVSGSYVAAIRENPLLDKQGDGMKSYAGILFEAIVASKDVTLIDEPE